MLYRTHPNTYPCNVKLSNSSQYRRVFERANRSSDEVLTVLFRENNLDFPRIGLAISKKCAKRAVDRNRIKRLVRESFRAQRHMLPAVDIVVTCRPIANRLSNRQIYASLANHWRRLILKCKNC